MEEEIKDNKVEEEDLKNKEMNDYLDSIYDIHDQYDVNLLLH